MGIANFAIGDDLVVENMFIDDSPGQDLTEFLNAAGRRAWGQPPPRCDDLTFARRIFLDVLGRVPSVSEIRDYMADGPERRMHLVDQLLYSEGAR